MPATPDLPEFAVLVGGAELPEAVRNDVLRIDVHEEVGKLARTSILLRNWSDDTQAVTQSEDGPFAVGAEVELQLGYNGELETVFAGIVVELTGTFTEARQPVLEVGCRCKGALLAGARRSRVAEDVADGDVVSTIASEAGLQADADAGAQQPFVVQRATTDWEYLSGRAEALGLALYVRGDTLVFKPPAASAGPALTLEWTANVLELELTRDPGGKPEKATASSWDPDAADAADSEAAPGDAGVSTGSRPALDADLGDAGWPGREERIPRAGAVAPDELDLLARGRMRAASLAHGRGRGRILGLPSLRIDSVVGVERVGDALGGSYYVGAVRHVLDTSGYTTEFQLGLPAPLRPAAPSAERGLAVGVVDDIDDPNAWGRVRVKFPWLDPDLDSVWARLALPAAGAERGFFFIPEVGDEVVVGFLDGDLRFPVVLGSLWNGAGAPPESLDAQKNDVRALVSRAGHKLTFDDGDSAPLVKIETAAGQIFTLDDTSGSEKVSVQDKTGNKLEMSSSGITLEAASGDVKIKAGSGKIALDCLQLECKASSAAKIESSATLDIKASATLGLKGALVNIG
jgi:Rhs element Vgr protein